VIKIVTDSTNYLPAELIAEHDIHIVPQILLFGNEVIREGVDMDTERFFQRLSGTVGFPTTAHPSLEGFLALWGRLLDAGHEVITILMSSRLSGTWDTAMAALKQLPAGVPISIVDSLAIAMALGMQVLHAAELARAGHARDEIVASVERMRQSLNVVLVLDSLEYLHRGGRINAAKAWLGTVLSVKSLLTLEQGLVQPLEQARTSKRALSRLWEWTVERLGDDPRPWISVMHSRSPDGAQSLLERLRSRFPGGRFFCSEIGPILAAHVGPGGLGVITCPSTVF
jgi:DegV family protein with EDD domain